MVHDCVCGNYWARAGRRRRRACLAFARSALALAAVMMVAPTETRAGAPVEGLPYAFAHRLGSGIYAVDGRTIQIYRLGASLRIRELSPENRWGVRLTLPVTVGFYDFEFEDILETGLPEHASTISLVPGVEVSHQVRERWTLTPYGEAGAAWELTEGKTTWVGAAGVRSLVEIPQRSGRWLFGADLFYSAAFPEDGDAGGYGELDLGLDRRWPMNVRLGEHELEIGVFGVQYWYWLDSDIVQTADAPEGAGVQYEFGFSLGTVRPLRVVGLRMPRVGLSYRFGEGSGAIRFILGKPF